MKKPKENPMMIVTATVQSKCENAKRNFAVTTEFRRYTLTLTTLEVVQRPHATSRASYF